MRIDESRTACNYTPGRQGRNIVDLVIHHWGLDGQTHDGVVDWFCNPAKGATTSAHFVVSAGLVHCIVSPSDTAWHAGDWDENLQSIGIECRPEATAADYKTVAELVRWLRTQYGDLPLRPHKAFFQTSCPGRWDLARLDREARGGKTPVKAPPSPDGAMRPAPGMYPITQRYRENSTAYNSAGMHGALDYGVPVGTPLVAPEDGVVVFDGWAWDLPGGPNDWASRWYLIKPARGDTKGGGGIITIFRNSAGSHWALCHASQSFYQVGDRVRAGQVLQRSGATGIATGPHSHVNLWPAYPNWGNGAYGAIDPEPWITRPYAPITATSWQGSATTGTGTAANTRFDFLEWITMANQTEINKALTAWASSPEGQAVIGRAVLDRQFKDSQGRKISLAYVLKYDKANWDTVRAIAQAVRPSSIALAVWSYKSKLNGNKDAYQLLTNAQPTTAGSTTTKEA